MKRLHYLLTRNPAKNMRLQYGSTKYNETKRKLTLRIQIVTRTLYTI